MIWIFAIIFLYVTIFVRNISKSSFLISLTKKQSKSTTPKWQYYSLVTMSRSAALICPIGLSYTGITVILTLANIKKHV